LDDRALADRLVNYADALVAVSFVGMSGLSIALADPDVRCSLTRGVFPVMVANLISAAGVSVLLVILRSWESNLRSPSLSSPRAARYLSRLHIARFVIVWLSAAAAVATLFAATRDPACAV
jgi:hypothetical protein